MTLPPAVLFVIVIVIGFLTGSTVYFYNKSHSDDTGKSAGTSFQADIPQLTGSESSKKIDELTKPADPKGRITYPEHVYTVEAKETLFGIGTKFGVDWKLIKLANGVSNENLIQAGYTLVIPKIEASTDLYRITFKLNEDKASETNRSLRDVNEDAMLNPLEVARNAVPYFGIKLDNEFTIIEQNNSVGTALIQAKSSDATNYVGLYQPKEKGKKGFWVILYVEHRP